ncbi:PKD domain-containing protein [uncultured Marivirga sp.]|uniref:PKD domain-containing protein n=1 Tax=uncultured Marivirga sp. TaxID=1123707 RepID=UPI0030EC3E85
MKEIFFIISACTLTLVCDIYGQSPVADFNIPTEVCLEEQFQLENISVNADSFEWDFCPGEFSSIPTDENYASISGISQGENLQIYQEDFYSDTIYVFVASGNGSIYTAKVTKSTTAVPSFQPINIAGTSFSRPIDFSVVKLEGNYYGYLIDLTSNFLYEFSFGGSLQNDPVISNLGDFGSLNNPYSIKAVVEQSNIKLLVSNLGTNYLTIVERESDGIYSSVNLVTGSNQGWGLGVEKINGTWWIAVAYRSSNQLRLIDQGSSIDLNINSNTVLSNASTVGPTSVSFETEGDSTSLFVKSTSTGLMRFKFGRDLTQSPDFQLYGNLTSLNSNFRGFTFFKDKRSIWNGLMVRTTSEIRKIEFSQDCPIQSPISFEESPISSFDNPGSYYVNLKAFNSEDNYSAITKDLVVSSNEAPTGEIVLDAAYCVADNISYKFDTSDEISIYNWDFGDGNSSNDISPTHKYGSGGEYIITLEVESTSGCPNIFYDTLNILPEPQAEFSTAATEFCTFESINFANDIPFDFGANIEWSWSFNGEGSSTAESPNFTFETSGTKTITLKANVLGCVDTYQSTLDIMEGPEPAFEYDKNCLGEAIQFTNLSTGANITGFQWDFGNGESSTDENPQAIYDIPGNYTVELTVSNASGCENTTVQSIQLFDQIVDSVMATEAIENLPFELSIDWRDDFDSTQNLTYQWEIDGEIQTSETAEYTLAEGVYSVNLEIISAGTCIFYADRTIEVKFSEKPSPDFNLSDEICLDEQFELGNISVNADSYEWDFCPGEFSSVPNDEKYVSISGLSLGENLQIYQEDFYSDSIYVFVASGGGNLYKSRISKSTEIAPSFEAINFSGASFSRPIDFSVVRLGENYYGYLIDFNTSFVHEFDFGSSLRNDPTISNLGDFSSLNDPYSLKAVNDQGNIKLLVSNLGANYLTIIERQENGTYTSSDLATGSNQGWGLDVIKVNNNWWIAVSYRSLNQVRLLDQGNSIDVNINSNTILSNGDTQGPTSVSFETEGDSISLFVKSTNNGLMRFKYFDDLTQSPDFQLYGNLESLNSSFRGFTFFKDKQSAWNGLMVRSTSEIRRIQFNQECYSPHPISFEESPVPFFSQPGTYPITLTATHPNGNTASITKEITVTENQAPDIAFTTGDNLCIANAVEFESQSTAELNSYQWDFGDGEISTEANPNHTFATAGTYAVKLSVSDTSGCSNLFVDSVQVFEQPVPDFQASAQGSVCSQKPIVFDNLTTLPTEATFFWEFGDGNTSTEENPEHIYQEAGEYIVIQSINMAGCEVEKTDTISVNPGPIVAFQTANNCLGEILQFENTSQGDFLESFQWDFGDGTQSTQTNPSHLYDTAGTYNVQLTALTSNGCDFTISQDVNIQPLASVAFEAEVACANQPVQFSEQVNIAVSNITDYFWDFGVSGTQTDVSAEANPTFAFPASGSYNVRLQVSTSDGCTTDTTQTIMVNALPQPDFEFENSCINESRLFTPQNSANITAHFWELQNAQGEILQSSQSENFAYLFSKAGNYQLTYRQENENLCSNAITKSFTINELPEPDFAWGTACAGEAVEFENLTDLNGNNLKKYNWSIDGEVISTDARPQYVFENSGDYLLSLQVETQGGCVQSVSKEISISPAPTAFFELTQNIGAYPFTLSTSPSGQDYPLEGIIGVSSKLPTTNSQLPTSSSRSDDSQTGSSYVWLLGNDTISNSQELNYTITQPGTYLLGLILTNEAGCSDEYYEQIRVREPSLDVSLSNLRVSKDDEFTTFVLNISNRGSLVPDRIDLDVDLGSYSVTESLETPLYPESNRNFSLSLKLTDEQLRGLSKICINATPKTGDYNDSNSQNNRLCTNLESGFKVMDIYPNPAVNQFTIPLIIPETDQLTISMEDSNGRQVKIFNYDLEAGYNEIQIQRESLSPGIYFLRFRHQGQEKVKKIIFQ